MQHRLALVFFAFFSVLTFQCQGLIAQTQDAQTMLRASDFDIHTCDRFKNPVPGESVADAARRIKAGKNCTEKVKTAVTLLRERICKTADLDNGFVKVAVAAEVSTPSFLIALTNVYVRNTSPIRQAYTLTVRCGNWSRTVSGNVDASDASETGQAFGKPAFSLDVSPACKALDSRLELSSPDEVKGKPEERRRQSCLGFLMTKWLDGCEACKVPGRRKARLVLRFPTCKSVWMRLASGNLSGELATAPVSSVGDHMKACATANDELTAALKVQGEAQNKARTETMNQPIPGGALVVRLTGTDGLPFSGTCFYTNRAGTVSKSYDEVLPFQTTVENVDSVNCHFISKSDFHHDLELEIVRDGKVIGESDTDAPYGLVGVTRDVN